MAKRRPPKVPYRGLMLIKQHKVLSGRVDRLDASIAKHKARVAKLEGKRESKVVEEALLEKRLLKEGWWKGKKAGATNK